MIRNKKTSEKVKRIEKREVRRKNEEEEVMRQ